MFFSFLSLEQHLKNKEMGREMGYGRGGYHIYIYIYIYFVYVYVMYAHRPGIRTNGRIMEESSLSLNVWGKLAMSGRTLLTAR